jgi:hypothetical protein
MLAVTLSRDPDFNDPADGGIPLNFHLKTAPKLFKIWGPPQKSLGGRTNYELFALGT